MRAEDEVVTSPLSRTLEISGHVVRIAIYRGTQRDDDWMLEVVDETGVANVSNETYSTDRAALDAAINSLRHIM